MAQKLNLLFGADPELFVRHKVTRQLTSAHTLIPGTKASPFSVPKGAIQVDGVAAEFNIDPAGNSDEFADNIETVIKELIRRMPDYELVMDPVAVFNPDYFKGLPEETKELGCTPDWNAWTETVNPRPDPGDQPIRTASGHIHFGFCENADVTDKSHMSDVNDVVKQLDYYLGLYSLLWDHDSRRRLLYGKAGACRYKTYGGEYRVLSNRWLSNRPMMKWVYRAAYKAVYDLVTRKNDMVKQFGNLAQELIDNNVCDWINNKKYSKLHYAMDLPQPPYNSEDTPVLKNARHSFSQAVELSVSQVNSANPIFETTAFTRRAHQ